MNQCSDNSCIIGAKHPWHQLRVITNNLAPFRGSTNPNSCNTHIQTPCPENHRFGDSTVGCIKFRFFANFKQKNTGYASLGFKRRKNFFFFFCTTPQFTLALWSSPTLRISTAQEKNIFKFFFFNVFLYISRTL